MIKIVRKDYFNNKNGLYFAEYEVSCIYTYKFGNYTHIIFCKQYNGHDYLGLYFPAKLLRNCLIRTGPINFTPTHEEELTALLNIHFNLAKDYFF